MDSITPRYDVEQGVEIIDIRTSGSAFDSQIKDDILAGLRNKSGQKTLPTVLIYNERGLKLFEDITYLDEYYLTNTEIAILEQYATDMAARIEDGGIIVELGSGNLRKVNILLRALDRLGKRVTYYALDLDRSELSRTLLAVPPGSFKNIKCVGLHGTYDDGRAWLRSYAKDKSRCILWLGSSAGNFDLEGAAVFLREWAADVLRVGKRDSMLVGLDGCKSAGKVRRAYTDSKGITRDFILNGLWNANGLLGEEYFVPEEWDYVGNWNAEIGRHESYCEALKDVVFTGKLLGITVEKGERINIAYSHKFDDNESRVLWSKSGLVQGARWANAAGDYYLHMLYKPAFFFPLGPPSSEPAPTLAEWKELWTAWDLTTLGMAPLEKIRSNPQCIFYLGHVPAFLDMHLTRATNGEMTTPGEKYQDIFQCGGDPTHCQVEVVVPDSWPLLEDIMAYTSRVRERTLAMYSPAGRAPVELHRTLWLAFEHEAMHLETLLYMLLQSQDALPPPGVTIPDFASERRVGRDKEEKAWVEIPKQVIDLEDGGAETSRKSTEVVVPAFTARTYPITNGEYARYLHATSSTYIPTSWASAVAKNGVRMSDPFRHFLSSYCAKTVFGPVPMALAADWPAIASYDELSACVAWMGGRIPTADELRAAYSYSEAAQKIPADGIDTVTVHPINNRAQRAPCAGSCSTDLSGHNVGFNNWRPTSVRSSGGRVPLGHCTAGGAWEWTSSVLERREGFREGGLCSEYTVDSSHGKHNIVLGGGWATHPRIAGRKSFVNGYRRNDRCAWATARIATT